MPSIEFAGVHARDVHINQYTQPRTPVPDRVVVGEIPREPLHFVTRPQLAQLRSALRRSAAVVTGMRGAGKTQLAAAYTRAERDAGLGLVGWVNAETLDTARAGLSDIARQLGVADPDGDAAVSARRLRDFLAARVEPGLLVLDNASDPDDIRPLLPISGSTRVLITTTDQSFTALGEPIDLTGYTRAESVRYLEHATKLTDDHGAAQLAETLGDLPLALSMAATTITGRRLDYRAYGKLLHDQPLPNVLARKRGHDYPISVTQAILLSIDTIEAATDDPALDAEVEWLLGVIAMLSPAGVHRAILPDRSGRIDEALDRCATGSLLSWSSSGDTVTMHRVIARVLRERAQHRGTELVTAALDVIAPHLFDAAQAWARRDEGIHLVDQVDALWDTGMIEAAGSACVARTLEARRWAAVQLTEAADIARAVTFGRYTLTDSERLLGADHPDTLTSRHSLAITYESAGRLDDAIALHEATFTDRGRVLGTDHPDTFTSRHNLAHAYRSAGRLNQAIALYEATLADRERILGTDHPDTLFSRHSLANAYRSAGQLDQAITLHEATSANRQRIYGPDDPRTLTSHHSLADTYRSAGRLDQAIALHKTTLTHRERLLGTDHPDTLTSRHSLANAYRAAGLLELAIALHESTLNDRERIYGPNHPLTLTSRHSVADTYRAAGRLDEAIAWHETTLAIRRNILGPDHPITLFSRHSLAYAYRAAGRLDEAIALTESTLRDRERLLGPDHPITLTSRHSLAVAYQAAGRLDEAIALHEATLADRLRIIGAKHPYTFSSRIDLAGTLEQAGRLGEAIIAYGSILADSETVFGAEHPITDKARRKHIDATRRRTEQGP